MASAWRIAERIFILGCLIGFLYQLSILISEYCHGKTWVSIEISGEIVDNLPAITICPGGALNITELANNQDYMSQVSSLLKDKSSRNLSSEIYSKIHHDFLKFLNTKQLDLYQEFNKLSYPFKNHWNSSNINITIITDKINEHAASLFERRGYYQLFTYIGTPIESIVLGTYDAFKCFTFFSHLDQLWKNITQGFGEIQIEVKFDYDFFPIDQRAIPMLVHSANDMPFILIGNVNLVNKGIKYFLQFSRVKIERLGRKYDTDCRDYGPNQQYITRFDCIFKCFWRKHNIVCNASGNED